VDLEEDKDEEMEF
jgi:hypothetical protein